jgi:hypothetical protein
MQIKKAFLCNKYYVTLWTFFARHVYTHTHIHILYKACIYYPTADYVTYNKTHYTWFTVGVINMKQDNQQSSPVTRISCLCHILTLCLHEIPFNKCILTATTYFNFLNTECIIYVLTLWLSHLQDATETQSAARTSLFWNCLGGGYAATCVLMSAPQQYGPMEQWLVHNMFIMDAFHNNSDNYTATQQLLHWHFQIRYKVQHHQLTASKLNQQL